MSKGKIIILSGPSGSGKTTLYKRLLLSRRLKKKLVKSISVTTRPKRPGEKNGRDYLFVSRKMFLSKVRAGHFLEWEKVFDNYYGTPKIAVRRLLKEGKKVLLCIDVKGAGTVIRRYKKAVRIFVAAPSLAALKKRLKGRGSETSKSLDLRMRIARQEMREKKKYDYVVVNDDLTKAYKKLEKIIYQETRRN
jgi:guanylate kinase